MDWEFGIGATKGKIGSIVIPIFMDSDGGWYSQLALSQDNFCVLFKISKKNAHNYLPLMKLIASQQFIIKPVIHSNTPVSDAYDLLYNAI